MRCRRTYVSGQRNQDRVRTSADSTHFGIEVKHYFVTRRNIKFDVFFRNRRRFVVDVSNSLFNMRGSPVAVVCNFTIWQTDTVQ